jgi:hypothetical protein
VKWLKIRLEHAKISERPIFRRLIGRDQIGEALHPGSIAPIFKRVAEWIGMPARFVAEVSGHSTRVGAAQDLVALDIDLAAITQAGGWKSTRMPLGAINDGYIVSIRQWTGRLGGRICGRREGRRGYGSVIRDTWASMNFQLRACR